MKSLKDFLQSFFESQGQYVFGSLFIAKVCAFLGSLIIIRLLPESTFGVITIVASVFAIFAPFNGFGSQQSLLRYGSLTTSLEEKQSLSDHLFRTGFLYQILLTILFIGSLIFFKEKYESIEMVFLFFSIRLLGFFFYNHIQSYYRIFGNNRTFAKVNNVVNIGGLILLIVLTYFFELKGYLISMAITPFLSLFFFQKKFFRTNKFNFSFSKKSLFEYGIFTAATALLSDLLFSLDILLLQFLTNEEAVANYKVAILLPANVTFLALVFMQTDFPKIAQNYKDKTFLKNYISNYYKIFIPICLVIFGICYLWSEQILILFFDEKYVSNSTLFIILLFAFLMNMLFRNLYGNMLSAVGKIKINTVGSFITLPVFVGLAFALIPKYELLGIGFAMATTLVLSGFFYAIAFHFYLRKL